MAVALKLRTDIARPHAQPREEAPHLSALTGLRFIAALLVVLHHTAIYDRYSANRTTYDAILGGGSVGVNFFFVLSGFILTYTYTDIGGHMRVGRRSFWVARIARILPVYLVAWLIAAPPYLWTHPDPGKAAVTALSTATLTQSWFPVVWVTTWNAPSWTLSVEAFFYLLFPALALVGSLLTTRGRLLGAFCFCWIACFAVPLLCDPAALTIHSHGPLPDSVWAQVAWRNPAVRLPEFLLGIVVGRLFLTRQLVLSQRAWAYVSVVACCLILLALTQTGSLSDLILHEGIIDPLCAMLIYALAFNAGPLAAFLSHARVVLLGEASYALYILHEPLWSWMTCRHPGIPASANLQTVIFVLIYLGLAIGLSLMSLRLIERPLRRVIRAALAP